MPSTLLWFHVENRYNKSNSRTEKSICKNWITKPFLTAFLKVLVNLKNAYASNNPCVRMFMPFQRFPLTSAKFLHICFLIYYI